MLMLPTAVKLPAAVGAGVEGAEGVDGVEVTLVEEAEGVDRDEVPQPVGRSSRLSERANAIIESQGYFRNCDFMALPPDMLSCLARMLTLIANSAHHFDHLYFCVPTLLRFRSEKRTMMKLH